MAWGGRGGRASQEWSLEGRDTKTPMWLERGERRERGRERGGMGLGRLAELRPGGGED